MCQKLELPCIPSWRRIHFDLILKQLFTNNTNEGSICTYTVIYLEWCKSAAVDFKISSDLLNSGC